MSSSKINQLDFNITKPCFFRFSLAKFLQYHTLINQLAGVCPRWWRWAIKTNNHHSTTRTLSGMSISVSEPPSLFIYNSFFFHSNHHRHFHIPGTGSRDSRSNDVINQSTSIFPEKLMLHLGFPLFGLALPGPGQCDGIGQKAWRSASASRRPACRSRWTDDDWFRPLRWPGESNLCRANFIISRTS